MHLLLRLLLSAAALYITVAAGRALGLALYLEPGVAGAVGALIAAVILGLVNAVIRPIVRFVALPLNCLTLGLFGLVINAALFWTVGQITPGYHVRGFIASLFGTLVMGIIGGLLSWIVVSDHERPARRGRIREGDI